MMTVESWDSMAHMELVAALESAYDTMFDPTQIIAFSSYEDGKKLLIQQGIRLD